MVENTIGQVGKFIKELAKDMYLQAKAGIYNAKSSVKNKNLTPNT